MRKALLTLAVLASCLAGGAPAQAGLYNTAEDASGPNPVLREYLDKLAELRSVAIEQPERPIRKRYLLAAKVDPNGRGGNLTVEQRVDLSAYLVRLRRYEDAVEVLRPAERQEPTNFMVLSNLATAHQLAGQLDRAVSYLERALKVWPAKWPGVSDAQLERWQQAEKYQLQLLRLRAQEAGREPPGRSRPPESVDGLFPVRFVGDSGQYEAGKLSAAETAKLPDNALEVVEQLLAWMPEDLRLYWLLGEVLNARGDVAGAAKVFEDLSWSFRFNAPEFIRHRRVLQEAKPAADAGDNSLPGERNADPRAAAPGPMTNSLLSAAVGAVAGMLVTALIFLQVREVRRRRGGVAVSRKG
jgi:tetratricopeptide (TPR) repeat protein